MSVKKSTFNVQSDTEETLIDDLASTQGASMIHVMTPDTKVVLDSGTTPAPSKVWSKTLALVAGALTIDLTALDRGAKLVDENFDTLKVLTVKIVNRGASAMTFKTGATNGYNIFGASGLIVIQPSGQMGLDNKAAAPVIGASAKTIDITGTGTEQFEISILAGT